MIPSGVSEVSNERNPRKLVQELALRKALDVCKRVKPGTFVLGADTLVVLKGRILGKPRDRRHAYQMLYKLSGSTHEVVTGVALVLAGMKRQIVRAETSRVRMKKIEIDQILKLSRKHLDKAGSYAIQENRDPIARVVKGSYDNVVGLPTSLVRKMLVKLSS